MLFASAVSTSASRLALCLAGLLAAGDSKELRVSRLSLMPIAHIGWSGMCAEGPLLRSLDLDDKEVLE